MTPKISVIIPNYNHGHLIEESISSICEQSVAPDEIIVINDGSTDNSIDILKRLKNKIPALQVISYNVNKGALCAAMLGVNRCSGDILTFRAADDIMPQESLKCGKSAFVKYPESKIAFGDISFFCKDINNSTIESLKFSDEIEYFSPTKLLKLWQPDFNLPEPACFVSKSALLEQGGLFEEAKWYSGWLCFTSIALKHGVTFIPAVLNSFKLDANSYGTANLRNLKMQQDVLRFLIKKVMSYDSDLKKKFIDCGAFTIFGESLQDLLSKERHSLPKNSELLYKNGWIKDYIGEELPKHGIWGVIANRLQNMIEKISSIENPEGKAAFVYGAGLQTSILLHIWEKLSLPTLSGIIVSQKGNHPSFQGYPVLSLDSIAESETYLIVLSSKSFELEMAESLDKSMPSVKRLSFWIKELTKL